MICSYLVFLVLFWGIGEFHSKEPLVLVCFPIYIPDNKEYDFCRVNTLLFAIKFLQLKSSSQIREILWEGC